MTVLANNKEMDKNRTLARTSHSITILGCLDRLTYSVDCTQAVTPFWEVQCLTNCSHGPYKPATNLHSNDHVPINQDERNHTLAWVPLACFSGVIILLFAGKSYRCVDRSRNRNQRISVNVDNAEETKV